MDPVPLPNYPKVSPDANTVYELVSNKEKTHFFIDGTAMPVGRRVKVLIDENPHTIVAQPEGCIGKEEFVQPPYAPNIPLSFTFLIGECNKAGDVATITPAIPPAVVMSPTPQPKPEINSHKVDQPQRPTPNLSSIQESKPSKVDAVLHNENRIALIVGNSSYQSLPPLKNPENDAEDMLDALKSLGFDVLMAKNTDLKTLRESVYKFGEKLKNGGVGLFYYSGHGVQVKGENYLVPIDAKIDREDDVKYQTINANDVLDKMGEGKTHLNFVFLDACRNNPLPTSTRTASRGLGRMDPPSGTLLIFSTNPGNVALDGNGRNGTFTKHLLRYIQTPQLEVGMMLRKVRTAVKEETSGEQVPWENGAIEGEFFFSNR